MARMRVALGQAASQTVSMLAHRNIKLLGGALLTAGHIGQDSAAQERSLLLVMGLRFIVCSTLLSLCQLESKTPQSLSRHVAQSAVWAATGIPLGALLATVSLGMGLAATLALLPCIIVFGVLNGAELVHVIPAAAPAAPFIAPPAHLRQLR